MWKDAILIVVVGGGGGGGGVVEEAVVVISCEVKASGNHKHSKVRGKSCSRH